MPLTRVIQLGTKHELFYGLPPAQAVVCAYEQYAKHNGNAWEYNYSKARIGKSGLTVHCGDFSAMLDA